jgi:hypothetical protein
MPEAGKSLLAFFQTGAYEGMILNGRISGKRWKSAATSILALPAFRQNSSWLLEDHPAPTW